MCGWAALILRTDKAVEYPLYNEVVFFLYLVASTGFTESFYT